MNETRQTATPAGSSAWSEDVDGVFFRIVADLFPPSFTSGAGALLSSNDPES